jgi:small subunit ribosomal protein S17
MAETTAPAPRPRQRQRRIGRVVSAKMDKTIVVNVARRVQDPLYKRVVRRRKNFYAHDEHNQCREGDLVRIEETRPLSKLKRWRLVEVVERARA